MYYEINIAKGNGHFFATAERSIQDEATLRKVYTELRTRFPTSEGWRFSVSRWSNNGYQFSDEEVAEILSKD